VARLRFARSPACSSGSFVNRRTAAATIEAVSTLWPDLEPLSDSIVV
jgi:hypothetical protein